MILGFSRFSGTKEIIRIDNKHFFFNFSQYRVYLSLLRMICIPLLYPLRCFEILQILSRDSRTTDPAVRGPTRGIDLDPRMSSMERANYPGMTMMG